MNVERYPVTSNVEHSRFEFSSEGPRGAIKKVVEYQHIGRNIFNLAFGDWDEETQKLKDNVRTNNLDRNKVLATVAHTVIDFTKYYPDTIICAQGNTPAKTRLYQMGISSNLSVISKLFSIGGYVDDVWEPFNKQKNYDSFTLTAKSN